MFYVFRNASFTGHQHSYSYASLVLAIVGISVRPSVCHTLAMSKNDASRITKSSPTDSPRTQAFGVKKIIQKFERVHPERGR